MKIAVVGAGAAGMCTARHCLQENFSFDVFEQTGSLGGTWNYTDLVGLDEYGVPVHSSMYEGLRTNLPKELMAFEDFPYPPQERSYLYQPEVLDYLRSYADKFQIEPHVKFYNRVVWVEPLGGKWVVEYEDVRSKRKEVGHYDAVVVCNGHYKDPFVPEVKGLEGFQGGLKHSHHYRNAACYKGRRVLVLGAGPSGLDISPQILAVAKEVFLSHRSKNALPVPDQIRQKPIIDRLEGNTAFFVDGSEEEIDDILFCTGYNYSFPFLSPKCGVTVEDNYVHPLYKQMISVESPTLAFLGLPFTVCPFPMFSIQVRFFLSTLSGHFQLPSKEQMLRELEQEMEEKKDVPRRKWHLLGEAQGRYFEDLERTARIRGVPPVIHKLYMQLKMNVRNLESCFRIVDDETWEQVR